MKVSAPVDAIENRIASKSDISKASYETPRGFQMIREMVLDTQSEHLSVAPKSLNSDQTMKSDHPQTVGHLLQVPKQSNFKARHLEELNQLRGRGESNFAEHSD